MQWRPSVLHEATHIPVTMYTEYVQLPVSVLCTLVGFQMTALILQSAEDRKSCKLEEPYGCFEFGKPGHFNMANQTPIGQMKLGLNQNLTKLCC